MPKQCKLILALQSGCASARRPGRSTPGSLGVVKRVSYQTMVPLRVMTPKKSRFLKSVSIVRGPRPHIDPDMKPQKATVLVLGIASSSPTAMLSAPKNVIPLPATTVQHKPVSRFSCGCLRSMVVK